MRDYGKVFSRIWESADFRALTDDGRMLVMYLLTCQHGTISGVFRIPDGYACEDMGWDAERVAKGFANLSEKGFANRCETTKWVWIVKFLQWNQPENPNQRKAAVKQAQSVPENCSWRNEFFRVCGPSIGLDQNPQTTVPEPLLNQKQEQKQEQKKPRSRKTSLPDDFAISDRIQAWAKEHGHRNLERHLANFVSYAKRNGKTYADWDEALMTAIRDDWAKVGKAANDDDPYGLRSAL